MDAPALASWLKARIRNSEDDWRGLLPAMYEHLLAQPATAVVERDKVHALATAHLTEAAAAEVVRVAFEAGIRPLVGEGRTDTQPVGRWLDDEAKARLEAFAAQPDLVHPAWVEELFKQKAAEELLSETLYQALKDFSTLVPRILEKVLPSGLGRLAGFAAGVGNKVFDEVERLLDGEIRKFLEKGTRKGLERAASFATENLDGPTAVEGRRNLIRFALARSPQFHLERLTDERIAELQAIADGAGRRIAGLDETRALIDRTVDQLFEVLQGQTVGELMKRYGFQEEPPFDAWARATWPVVKAALSAPEVDAWIDRLAEQCIAENP